MMEARPRALDRESLRFHRLAPIPPRHPQPWFPMLPVLGPIGRAGEAFQPASRFLEDDVVFTASGAAAIYWALRDAGIGPDDEVIVPAYHCPTMITPVLGVGASVSLVSVESDLSIRAEAVAGAASNRTRAVLVPHYFGFRQPEIEAIAKWSARRRVVVLEDCAHCFYGDPEEFLPGLIGDYAIASTRKFFPGIEGGAVVANRRRFGQELEAPAWGAEALGLLGTLRSAKTELGMRSSDAPASRLVPDTADDAAARDEAAAAPVSAAEVDAACVPRRALRVTSALVRRTDHAASASVRRYRYARWSRAIAELTAVREFSPAQPTSFVPYVFPAMLRDPQRHHPALKYAGVQVWRWDRIAESDCQVSRRLAVELIQLPCSHSGADETFDALVEAFCDVLRESGRAR